jgi:carbonic anhydrase/acetyltransferase-like protein (isoleucine patch superfamily)
MTVYALENLVPDIHESAWVANSAQVIGSVRLQADVGIWFGAVLRGDTEWLHIGRGSNIQDLSLVHSDAGFPVHVGEGVTVGHQVTLHGCQVGDGSLIGMKATLLNGARIGRHCLVGAGSLVTEGKVFPDGVLIMGSPARVVRELTPEQLLGLEQSAAHYQANARRFRLGLRLLPFEGKVS